MSKAGVLGRLFSFLANVIIYIVQSASLAVSLGVTVYTVGEYTNKFLKDKPKVLDILHWRDPKKSAIALAVSLIALILFAKFSFVSLIAWSALAVLGATLGFRVYKIVESQIKKTDGSNPFKPYLESDLALSQEKIHAQADVVVQHGQAIISQLRRLFLVENVIDSVKFGILLWTLTYVGAWFSGITLLTIFILALFSVPKVYEIYKEPIDEYIGLAKENVDKVQKIVQEKIPFLKAPEKAEKKE